VTAPIAVRRDWLSAATATMGGVLLAIGAWLPWITLFAGLQRYSGINGLYGRLIFAGGAACITGAVAILFTAGRWLRPTLGVLGVVLAALATWDLIGLRATIRQLAHHPLLLPKPGPGLFVALGGAIIVAALLVPARRAHRRHR
jgi:hypothetical protein